MIPKNKHLISECSFQIVFLYAIVSLTYIYFSDAFINAFVENSKVQARLQTYKGFGFVLVTTLLLYLLVKRYLKQITENQQETENMNRKLATAQTLAKMGYWSYDLNNGEIYWSEEMYKIYEVQQGNFELSLDNLLTKIHPDDRHFFKNDLEKNFPSNITDNEHRILTDSGAIKWVYERIRLIRNEAMQPLKLEGVLIDNTQTHEHIHRIEQQNLALKEIAWTQSHVIRAPLATLMGLVNLLKQKKEMAIDETELIDHITFSAQQLDDIIRGIVGKTN